MEQNVGVCVCVVGDFNAIRREGERVGNANGNDSREMMQFDDFIEQSNLVDLSLCGRAFTWYHPDGTCKSKLDRVFVNDEWLGKWPDIMLRGIDRSLSDHCPILLDISTKDWGPRPFRFFNVWMNHPNFSIFVEDKWNNYGVSGRAGYVLKEKLKMLKTDLKIWNKEVFRWMDSNIAAKKERIGELDRVDDVFGLEEEEVIERKKVSAELLRDLLWKEQMLQQKSKARWVKEGDMNSKYFHCWINRRAEINEIDGLMIGDRWVDEVDEVRREVFNHFKKQFEAVRSFRPSLPKDLGQQKLKDADNEFLSAPFTEDEIRRAIWDCESSRSPGPDEFSFGFIKKY